MKRHRGTTSAISRRQLLQGSGAVIVWFSLAGMTSRVQAAASGFATTSCCEPSAPPQVGGSSVDARLAVGQDGSVTVFAGKVELGTGVQTALAQIAADELDVPFDRVTMVMGDTAKTPDEGYTAGSKTIQNAGPPLRKAAAQARHVLLELASDRLRVPMSQLTTAGGFVSVVGNPSRAVSYGELIGGRRFERVVADDIPTKDPGDYAFVGASIPRVDLPGKLTGTWTYVHDVRVDGMLHGRVVRPAGVGATLASIDEASVQDVPGLLKVVRNGSFVGVVARDEWPAIQAARKLTVTWNLAGGLPTHNGVYDSLRAQQTQDREVVSTGDVDGALQRAARVLRATYRQPYQAHASIGPACAVADVRADSATVWSSTQGVYQLRDALSQLLGMAADKVQVVHLEGAGCYGHNGFDDAAADAALLSQAVGRPVRVQWMREDEFAWEPKGPAMIVEVRAGLDASGTIVAWDYGVWTPTHSTRPGGMAANLLAGQLVEPAPPPARNGLTGGDRNARTNYTFANNRVVAHWITAPPLRPSALRSLGGAPNTFANESFMDELAAAAGVDPVEFRLRHLDDPRGIAVIAAAARRAGWQTRPSPAVRAGSGVASGRGVGFARYENVNAYVATVAEVDVDRGSGQVRVKRLVIAHDCGLIINPDGLVNQIEGNAIQSTSRALKEEITFDENQVTSLDWRSYPILTFPEVPDVEVELINRPDQPAVGAGEPATLPTAPAIANAIFDATGARVRAIPMTPERVKAALG